MPNKKILIIILCLISVHTFGQDILIPYRSGKLWGLADTLGKIRVQPSYDEIDAEKYLNGPRRLEGFQYFVTVKGNKYGVLRGTELIMPPKYHTLRIDSVFIKENNQVKDNPTYGGSRTILYNLKGKQLFPDTIMNVVLVKMTNKTGHSLYIVEAKGNYGIFWYDRKKGEIKQWIAKNRYFIGQTPDLDRTKVTELPERNSPGQTYELVYDAVAEKYEMKTSAKTFKVDANRENSALYPGSQYQVKNNYVIKNIKFERRGTNIYQLTTIRRQRDRNEKTDTAIVKLKSGNIALNNYKIGDYTSWHNTKPPHNPEELEKIDTVFEYVNYVRYVVNGKTGVVVDDVVVPAKYVDVIYFNSYSTGVPYFMVSQLDKSGKKKWGVIDAAGKIVQPVLNEQIIRTSGIGGAWIVKRDGLYGIANHQGKLLSPVIYQAVVPDQTFAAFSTQKNGKYGHIDAWRPQESVNPIFPFRVKRVISFGGHQVFELIDANRSVVGYGDRKGQIYFSN